jgi:hypothetical protein
MDIVNSLVTIVVGFGGIFIGHWLATRQEKRQEKWQELAYRRSVFEQNLAKVQQIARVSGALDYVYSDDEQKIEVYTLQEQYAMRQARKARQRIVALSKELGIEAGLSKDDVALQKLPVHLN